MRRRLGVLTAGALFAVLVVPYARATEEVSARRLAGADRYATAVAVARAAYPDGVGEAVVASGEGFADALAASYVGGVVAGPVLLVTRSTVPSVTATALESLGVTKVYIVGGTAAVSAAVEAQLARDYAVERLAGADRYATASTIKQHFTLQPVGRYNGKRTALVTSGETFADALAAGPIAFGRRFPLLLTGRDFLPKATEDGGLDGIEHVIVVGGEAAVGQEVYALLERKNLTVERIGGANRYDTAARLSEAALAGMTFKDTEVVLASGSSFADALTGATYAGKNLFPMLLMDGVPIETDGFVRNHNSTISTITVLGGEHAIPDDDVDAIAAAATCATSTRPTVTGLPVGFTTSSSIPRCSTPTTMGPTSSTSSTSSTSTSTTSTTLSGPTSTTVAIPLVGF